MTRNNPRADGWRPAGAVEGGPPAEAVSAAPKPPDSAVPFRALLAFTLMLLIPPQTYLPVLAPMRAALIAAVVAIFTHRSEEHRLNSSHQIISYAVFCLKKK